MPNYRRLYTPGGTYFLTVVTANRTPIFREEAARTILRSSIETVRSRKPFGIDAMVLLPDHFHLMLNLPRGDDDFSSRLGHIKAAFTHRWLEIGGSESFRSFSQVKRRDRSVWQRRFWEHFIRDESDFENHFHYVHYNPVKHGLVRCVIDWPYSTFHQASKKGLYPPDWGCAEYGIPQAIEGMDLE
jgi:putative transposase